MPEVSRARDADPLLAYIRAELARVTPLHATATERDRHYRNVLHDLLARAERATTLEERAFLAQRATAIGELRLEELRAALLRAPAESAEETSEFGATLQRLRKRAGLTQSELARQTGIDRAYVHRIERATATEPVVPSRQVVLALANALGLPRPETDSLLAAAGYLPLTLVEAGGWPPEVALVAGFLADPGLSEIDRVEFRHVLRLLLAHWRNPQQDQRPAG